MVMINNGIGFSNLNESIVGIRIININELLLLVAFLNI